MNAARQRRLQKPAYRAIVPGHLGERRPTIIRTSRPQYLQIRSVRDGKNMVFTSALLALAPVNELLIGHVFLYATVRSLYRAVRMIRVFVPRDISHHHLTIRG